MSNSSGNGCTHYLEKLTINTLYTIMQINSTNLKNKKMRIIGKNDPVFSKNLSLLFDEMESERTIKSVTIMDGYKNEDDTSKDREIKDFIAQDYETSYTDSDRVVTNKGDFYMDMVRSFELY